MPSHTFLRCGDYPKFLMGLGKFRQKGVTIYTFFRCGDYLKFLMGLGKFRQKGVTSYTFLSLWRLTWVFEGTWKNFHKKVCPVILFFAVETISSFWWDLEKNSTKICAQLHVFFAVETNLSFWWDLEKFSQKSVPSHTFLRCGDYLKLLRGLRKFRQKDVPSYTFFLLWRLTWVFEGTWKNFHKKKCAQSYVSSLWRLS